MKHFRFAVVAAFSVVSVFAASLDVFAGGIVRVSVTTSGRNGPGASGMPSISADGR